MIDTLIICLPTGDRGRSAAFYRTALALDFVGEPQGDGLPEPLQFLLNEHTALMMIPRDGFGYVLGGALIADPSTHSSVLTIRAGAPGEVDEIFAQCVSAGAEALEAPNRKPWGYVATIADPDGHPWLLRSD